jgi:2'-hydroxyisoflavone reductase
MGARSVSRARAAGLTFRPLIETLRDGLRSRSSVPADKHGAGLTDSDERELLRNLTHKD